MSATQACFTQLFDLIPKLTSDFEIKRFIIGFTTIITNDPS